MQRINTTNIIGLQTDLTALQESFAKLNKAWANDKDLFYTLFDQVRINPLQAEQHATTVRGFTVIASSDVPVGKIQLVATTPF